MHGQQRAGASGFRLGQGLCLCPLGQDHKGAVAQSSCNHLHEKWGEEGQRAPVRLQEPQHSYGLSRVMSSGHAGDRSGAREGLPLKSGS